MAYRKPHYRKDGTYVSASNDNRQNNYKNTNNLKDELIGVVITAIILIIILIKCS